MEKFFNALLQVPYKLSLENLTDVTFLFFITLVKKFFLIPFKIEFFFKKSSIEIAETYF